MYLKVGGLKLYADYDICREASSRVAFSAPILYLASVANSHDSLIKHLTNKTNRTHTLKPILISEPILKAAILQLHFVAKELFHSPNCSVESSNRICQETDHLAGCTYERPWSSGRRLVFGTGSCITQSKNHRVPGV